jgi:hypothetical protein
MADRVWGGADGTYNRSLSRTVTTVSRWRLGRGRFDPLADGIFPGVNAVDVGVVQDTDAVAGPRGDFGGFAGGVEPQGQGGVPQVVGAAGQRGGGKAGAERCLAGGVLGAAVDRLAEHAAAGAAEQPPVRRGAMVAEVTAEHADQDGRDGDDADGAAGAVLETGRLMRIASVGPGGAGARAGRGEDYLAASAGREDEVLFPAWILLLSVDILRTGLRQSPAAADVGIGAKA